MELTTKRQNRPKTRRDCVKMLRELSGVCPYVGCKWHVFTVLPYRKLRMINKTPMDDDDLLDELFKQETCILNVADSGESTLEGIGEILWATRERMRQIQESALKKIKCYPKRRDELELFDYE